MDIALASSEVPVPLALVTAIVLSRLPAAFIVCCLLCMRKLQTQINTRHELHLGNFKHTVT